MEMTPEMFAFCEGYFSIVDPELPDGAFFQMHVDLAQSFLDDPQHKKFRKDMKIPEDADAHEFAMAYFRSTA